MRRHIFAGGFALLLGVLACSLARAQDVRYNYMPGTDFSKFHTYRWIKIEGGAHPNEIVDAQIKQSVDAQLSEKGLGKTDSDTADLMVGYQIAVDRERQWNGFGGGCPQSRDGDAPSFERGGRLGPGRVRRLLPIVPPDY